MASLTIGKLARAAGVGVETVRFYERKALIANPPRRASGYRQYPADTVARIRFIKKAQQLGFTLRQIKELFALRLDPETSCMEVKQRAESKIADIEQKIVALRTMKAALANLVADCTEQGPARDCPILEAFDCDEAN